MRLGLVIAIATLALTAAQSRAQTAAGAMQITGRSAATWNEGETNVVQLTGPVTIELNRTTLTAENAVIWLRPVAGTVDQKDAEIALLGDATIKQNDATRSSGGKLFVTATVRGNIRITAARRSAQSRANSLTYQEADAVRSANLRPVPAEPAPATALPPTYRPALPVRPAPTTRQALPPPSMEVRFQADRVPITRGPDGRYLITLHGNLLLLISRGGGEFFEMRADHMVLFTTFKTVEEARKAGTSMKDKIEAVYLEGDVRINYVPGERSPGPEQRLTAERAYYELTSDRAILTDAVFHTIEPRTQLPVVMRAQTLRKLTAGEYKGEHIQLTTSTFANPSFAIAADKAYVRSEYSGNPRLGDRYTFRANHITPEFFGVPVFWLPVAGGSITESAFPLRNFTLGSSSRFGPSVQTEWGLLETFGYPSSRELDLSYRLDYYGDRGPAAGIDGNYAGGFVTETTKQPWNFSGEFRSYFVKDHGVDDLGGTRADFDPDQDVRGRVSWQHQHFLPDDWQLQLRAGYVSDGTFLEQWFMKEWEDGQPTDLAVNFKRQRETEALTLRVNYQPNKIVTDAEFAQEQFEIARLPEIGYHRIGDSYLNDRVTTFSNNTVSALKFQESNVIRSPLGFIDDLGFYEGVQPGLPAVGQTGLTGQTIYRGDFRQEVNYPINAGKFKLVPYVFGRLTSYSDSPTESDEHRLYVGGGVRLTTSFWRTNDTAESSLFDIHRLRHVIEPGLNLFTSGQTIDRNDVYIFDDEVDDIQDVNAVSVNVLQRWQTKRGGPGRWRNVDFFTLNLAATIYGNDPDDSELAPVGFRGLFFQSLPEASVPRDNLNADATWRISDDTVLLGDTQYNLEEAELATAAVGLAVRRDERLSWFVGTSYINEIDSNITSVGLTYQISKKYSFGYSQSFDFGANQGVNYLVTMNRKFDTFFLLFRATYDQTTDESAFGVNLLPMGAKSAFGTDTAGVFSPDRTQ